MAGGGTKGAVAGAALLGVLIAGARVCSKMDNVVSGGARMLRSGDEVAGLTRLGGGMDNLAGGAGSRTRRIGFLDSADEAGGLAGGGSRAVAARAGARGSRTDADVVFDLYDLAEEDEVDEGNGVALSGDSGPPKIAGQGEAGARRWSRASIILSVPRAGTCLPGPTSVEDELGAAGEPSPDQPRVKSHCKTSAQAARDAWSRADAPGLLLERDEGISMEALFKREGLREGVVLVGPFTTKGKAAQLLLPGGKSVDMAAVRQAARGARKGLIFIGCRATEEVKFMSILCLFDAIRAAADGVSALEKDPVQGRSALLDLFRDRIASPGHHIP